jgi:hypothetical protein
LMSSAMGRLYNPALASLISEISHRLAMVRHGQVTQCKQRDRPTKLPGSPPHRLRISELPPDVL